MRFPERGATVVRDVVRVVFGPWPMPTAILFIASVMLLNYVVAGPYPGSGSPLTYQAAMLPTTLISASAFAIPVWVSNRIRERIRHPLTRSWYLVTVVTAGLSMAMTRPFVISAQGFEVPLTLQSVAGFTSRGILMMLLVCSIAGVASSRIRLQTRRAEDALRQARESQIAMVETEERVRANVSAFLHDHVQASLVALGLQLKYIAGKAEEETSRQLTSLMEEVERIRTDDVRRAAHQLSPDLETMGLAAALRTMAETYAPAMRVQTQVAPVHSAEHRPTPEQALALYRITEQALLNAAVHGHASEVDVIVEADASVILLTVRDNGSGLPMGPPARGTGSLVMDSWAHLNGGTWRLEPGSDGGAVLRATLPVTEHV